MASKKGSVEKYKSITMKEIAQKSGVALSTVSHVINGTAPISDETKKRVWNVIKEENYSPNALARGLRSNHTNVIGVVVPDISNEFYAKASSAILRSAANKQVIAVIIDYAYNSKHEWRSVNELLERRVDGLIFIGGGNDEGLLDELETRRIPVVLADRRYKDFCSVEFDNKGAMEKLVEMLAELGYRDIGYISESLDMTNLQDRYEGVMLGLKKMGLEIKEKWLLKSSELKLDKRDVAKRYMQGLLENLEDRKLPEVIVTSSDMIAVGIIDALLQAGYKVPKDVGVIGYDNSLVTQYYKPSITTVFQDSQKLGTISYELLQRHINDELDDRHIILDCQVLLRDSTQKT